ncbi:ubiquinol oxidase subunit II [Paracoccus simplex]|uniref:Ubiquinol oxidase polypeptide II n=1 Tax=Paracoccus simplex TaxID=2086346 RepID=A0ABV7RY09_9RHOB
MKRNPKLTRLAWLSLLIPLAACKAEVLLPAGDVAARERDLLVSSTLLMLLIIVPVMALTVWFAWKYRERNRDAEYRPDWDHSTKLEFVIWAAPLLIIISLGALTWVGTHLLDPYRPLDRISKDQPAPREMQPLRIEVVALDWKWLFIYPEQGIASVNQMAVPVDRPVEFTLTSSSVMNAFYIPAMAGMVYAMPGMQTKLHGVFNNPGEYKGIASHYSGHGFSGMHFKALATDQAGFDAWIAKAREAGGTLDRPRYLELEAPSENVPPMTFAEVDPQLYPRIVNMCVEPGKICMAEMMALDAQGGTGLAGTMNVTALTYDKHQRRGARAPVLGWKPFQVASFCTPEEAALMFGNMPDVVPERADMTPLRGLAMTPPQPFRLTHENDVTLLEAAESGAARNF